MWQPYIRKTKILCRRFKKSDIVSIEKNKYRVKKGHFLCISKDKKNVWEEKPSIFFKNYKSIKKVKDPYNWNLYICIKPLLCKKMESDFTLFVKNKKIKGKKGDYICKNSKNVILFLVSNDTFKNDFVKFKNPK